MTPGDPYPWALAGALAVFVVTLVGVLIASRPSSGSARQSQPADPAGADGEPPALVNALIGHAKVGPAAASATLLDLAARRLIAVEQVGPALSLIRLKSAGTRRSAPVGRPTPGASGGTAADAAVDGPLFERLVLERLANLARDDPNGVVATGALTASAEQAARWWRDFRRAVIAEGKARGLIRSRFGAAQRLWLWLVAVLPAVAMGALAVHVGVGSSADPDSEMPGPVTAVVVAVLTHGALTGLWRRLDIPVVSAAGAEVARRWLVARQHLAGNRNLAQLPAAAVTTWGRPLAYAAAFGLAGRAVDELPLTRTRDANEAWSDYGGLWHRVEIRYPRPSPGLGRPGQVARRGLVPAIVIGLVVWLVPRLGDVPWRDLPVLRDLPDPSGLAELLDWPGLRQLLGVPDPSTLPGPLVWLAQLPWPNPSAPLLARLAVVVAVLLIVALPGRALADRLTPVTLRARLIRRSMEASGRRGTAWYWLVFDDGRSPKVTAYRCDSATYDEWDEGDDVNVEVYRRCRWVRRFTGITTLGLERPGSEAGDQAARRLAASG